MRSIFAKRLFSEPSQKKFCEKFWRLKKRFYNSHVLESQTNGKQVRRKNEKKYITKKQIQETEKPNRRERETKSLFCGKPIFEA